MKTPISTAAFLFSLAISLINPSHPTVAKEFSGVVETQVRAFFNEPLYPDQHHHNASLALAPEYYRRLENGSSITIAPFLRADSADDQRSHFDVREMNFLWLTDTFELKIGISKVFWGAAEFVHLVDIINQTDLVEAIDYEEKLGQPMVQLSLPFENDIMLGLRLTINDEAGSELLAGIVYDYENSGRALTFEASRRLGSRFKATLEAYFFSHLSQEDFLYDFRDDDHISATLAYYF